jgi:dipeptidyl aminopeptidase/acylaminoacyl peptidase
VCATALLAQGEVITPGENLVVEGIPPIPASLAQRVDRYTEFRSANLRSWHPRKSEMLISTRFGDTTQIHRVRMPGGAREQLTFFSERVLGASYQPKEGDYFVFAKDIGGNELYQVYRYDMATATVTLLTDGKSRNTGAEWSNAGDRIVYGSTRRTGRDVDLWMINPADPSTDHMLVELQGGGWLALDWSPDDSQILVREYISINESYLWLADAETGEMILVTPKDIPEKIAYRRAEFSTESKGLYVTTDRNSEFRRLAYIDLETKEHTYLTSHINWDVSDFELSPDGKLIAFTTNEEGIRVLHLLDTATGNEKPLPELPVGIVYGLEWHENSYDLGFNLQSAHSSGDVYSLDVQTGKTDRWTYSETAGLKTENFSEPELVHWESFDGQMISGFLYMPPKEFKGPRPVIVSIHGGPESQFRPRFLGRWNYFLNELGVALIFPNVRGSSGYGKTFLQLDNGFKREDSYKDINALYGGLMTLAVATNYNDRICCALDVVGISNLVTFLENTKSYRRDLRRAEYGDERDPEMRAFLENTAPVNNSTKITKPLFVVQGANDPRVPLSESEQMIGTVRKNNTPVWYLMAKDEGHGFAKKRNRDFQFYATVLFVKEFLLQ